MTSWLTTPTGSPKSCSKWPEIATGSPASRQSPSLSAPTSGAEVHPHRLRLGEILDRGGAVLAAEVGIALAAPWQPHIGIAVGVDPDRAGAGALGEALYPADVVAP